MANKKLNYTAEEINDILDKANTMELPTKLSELINDKGYLTEIPSEYITETELNDKGYLTEIPSEYITETELNAKGYLTEHQDISGKADKTELHSHSNKSVLDGITNAKIQSWDNKSEFSGNYNDLTNKPNIPSIEGLASEEYVDEEIKKIDVTNQLTDYAKKSDIPTIPTNISVFTNDKGYLTEIPSEYITETELNAKGYLTEHQDISGKADKTELHSHSNKSVLDGITSDMLEKLLSNINVGFVDPNENNAIGAIGLPQDTYTLRYKNNNNVLPNYYDIGVIESGKMFNTDMIKENIPPYDATKIGVYNSANTQVGNIPLFYFIKEKGERLYSFGVLSDVHNQTSQGAESTADLQRALTLFNGREDVEFTCISGDITETATEAEYKIYQSNKQTCSPDTPVYATPGNHDCYPSGLNLTLWKQYTGCERTYEVTYGNDHFLFLGMNKWSMGSSSCTPYLMEDLEWLSEKLEAYKNERCFIFTHLFFPEYAGNFKEIYIQANWLMGTQHDFLKDLLNYYTNTIWFSGHSHWKWHLQKYEDNANIERAGGWTVHIPSCASPIDSNGISSREGRPLESEGAIIDVYENYIDIRGIDLKNDMYIPTAKYRLDTTLVEILDRKCGVTLNLQNATSSNKVTEVLRGESYETTITASSSGIMDITVTMNGVNITSTAVNGNTISIDKVTGDIVINVLVIAGYSTDLLKTCDVQLNKRWSASSNEYKDQDGAIAFEVPYAEVGGRTIKLIGFPEEHGGTSTWYAYNASETMIGRIANNGTGVVWDSTALVNNGDGSYDIAISPGIFVSSNTPITETPASIYITMKCSSSAISSTNGFKMLVSDATAEEPDEPDEPVVDPDEPVEGFSTDLLETYDVKLNQRWSASSNGYTDQVGTIALAVPYADIKHKTLRLIGFTKAIGDGSAWYAYDSAGANLGRIANNSSGVIWDSTELVDNGDGSYDIVMQPEIFSAVNSGKPLTTEPTTVYITMRVDASSITSFDGCKMLVSDAKEEEPSEPDEPVEGFSTDLLQTYDVKLNQRWSSSSNTYVDEVGKITLAVPYSEIEGRTLRLIGFENKSADGSAWYAYDSSGTSIGRIAVAGSGVVWDSSALIDNGDGSYDLPISPEIFISFKSGNPLTEIPTTIQITMKCSSSSISSINGFRILVSD